MESFAAICAFGALAQDTRLEAFRHLVRHEPDGIAAGDLARMMGVPQNTLSTHLAIMARANLVSQERQGRSIIYRADLGTIRKLALYLLVDCCKGRSEEAAPLAMVLLAGCAEKPANALQDARRELE